MEHLTVSTLAVDIEATKSHQQQLSEVSIDLKNHVSTIVNQACKPRLKSDQKSRRSCAQTNFEETKIRASFSGKIAQFKLTNYLPCDKKKTIENILLFRC